MTAIDRETLRQLPKAELHCHLDGSVRPQTLLDLAAEYGVEMPRPDAASLGEFMTVRNAQSLEDYLARFEVTLSVMQRAEALERIAFELAEDAHRDGVWYIETRFSPILNVRGGLSTHDAVYAVTRGLERAERQYGVIARVIICALRDLAPDVSMELARLAVASRHFGVVGFDLAGGERGHPASRHARAFEYARTHDMACTCHAGEGDGAQSIREAVHTCCANRIGHGTRLFEDQALLDYVNDRRIAVEMCLTSNVQTSAAPSYGGHPLREYYEAGLNVVLSTDNRLMSATTLTDEYVHAADHLALPFADLARIAINGFESAFLPWQQRLDLIARARKAIAQLQSGEDGR
ncbi:MAG TPA: adenosine deaminase [Gemmatimonadaceae bacterium]|nr:adenosine deaminase [Gemmatimonadaceae bacterium]